MDNSEPVDNPAPTPSTPSTPSFAYKDSSFAAEIEALANQIESTGEGECKGIGEPMRREAIFSKVTAVERNRGNPLLWFEATEEALKYADEHPQTRTGELLSLMRLYPDGIADGEKASRSDELIRLVSEVKQSGKCARYRGKQIPGNLDFSGKDDWPDSYEQPQEDYNPEIDEKHPF